MLRRVGVLALISYGVLHLEPALDERFQTFYRDEIGPYWPPERKLVDSGYATMDFPFEELAAPRLEIKVQWLLSEFLGYLLTWSAVRCARDAGREDVLLNFADDISAAWVMATFAAPLRGLSICGLENYDDPRKHHGSSQVFTTVSSSRGAAAYRARSRLYWPGFQDMPPVLATAMMSLLLRQTCIMGLRPFLAPGQHTVGVHVDVGHVRRRRLV